ncbi:hypothetical protein [Granulicella sp. dw_53]|uniref:hypothetical protein n=1 Tax=Granulicella sp. dw_53 TaxID=2719792 RepID=UPI001BD21C60|nr:hypothetical protein [Granulicella sp. dw_53]
MHKFLLSLVIASSTAMYAQGPADTNATTPDTTPELSSTSAPAVATATVAEAPQPAGQGSGESRRKYFSVFDLRRERAPIGSFAATFTYADTFGLAGQNRSLMGWTATPEINFTKYLGLQADFTSLYARGIYPGQNRFLIAAGPRVTFAPHSKITPFVFGEGGEIRLTTKANNSRDWNPVAKAGIGLDYKLAHGFGFELIPGEYIGQRQDDDTWLNSYSARAGIVFNFYR